MHKDLCNKPPCPYFVASIRLGHEFPPAFTPVASLRLSPQPRPSPPVPRTLLSLDFSPPSTSHGSYRASAIPKLGMSIMGNNGTHFTHYVPLLPIIDLVIIGNNGSIITVIMAS